MKIENEIKGVLVTFFRDGKDKDYLKALNAAIMELISIIELNNDIPLTDICEVEVGKYYKSTTSNYSFRVTAIQRGRNYCSIVESDENRDTVRFDDINNQLIKSKIEPFKLKLSAQEAIRDNWYNPVNQVKNRLSELKSGDVVKLFTVDGTYSVIIDNIDFNKKIVTYEKVSYLHKNLEHKYYTVIFSRIKAIK